MTRDGTGLHAGPGLDPASRSLEVSRTLTAALDTGQASVLALSGRGGEWMTARILAHAALTAASTGRRVVWSTRTVPRRRMALALLRQGLEFLPSGTPVADRVTLLDQVSPTRCRRLRRALAARGAPAALLAGLERLATRGGLLAEAEHHEGGLPGPTSLLWRTATCPQSALADDSCAVDAPLIVQSHAATLREARLGRMRADLVLLDEAAALPGVAASMEMRLPLRDLAALARRVGADIAAPLAALQARPGERIAWCDGTAAAALREIAAALSPHPAPRRAVEPAVADAIAEAVLGLQGAADLAERAGRAGGPSAGVALVQEAGPTLAVASLTPGAWIGPAFRDRQVVLADATFGECDCGARALAEAGRQLGCPGIDLVTVPAPPAPRLSIHLAARETPAPFADASDELLQRAPQTGFYDAAARMIQAARAGGGRSWVRCADFGDVEQLAPRLGPRAILHGRGEDLGPLLARFAAEADGVLVTPAGWAGLPMAAEIANRVILRLPISRRDHVRDELLRRALERQGRTSQDIATLLEKPVRAELMWRIAQTLDIGEGDGVDQRSLWIADPRFPLPAGMIVEVWRGLTQGPAAAWTDLACALPISLRTPGGRSAYDRAAVMEAAE